MSDVHVLVLASEADAEVLGGQAEAARALASGQSAREYTAESINDALAGARLVTVEAGPQPASSLPLSMRRGPAGEAGPVDWLVEWSGRGDLSLIEWEADAAFIVHACNAHLPNKARIVAFEGEIRSLRDSAESLAFATSQADERIGELEAKLTRLDELCAQSEAEADEQRLRASARIVDMTNERRRADAAEAERDHHRETLRRVFRAPMSPAVGEALIDREPWLFDEEAT